MKISKEIREHIKKHADYPATKADIVKACNLMSDVSSEDKKWFEKTLPEGTYNNSNEVLKALR